MFSSHSPAAGLVSPLGVPWIKPPYDEIAVVDLAARKTLWRQPLGTGRDSGPFHVRSLLPIRMGVPASGHFLMKSGEADYLLAYALPRT